MQVSASIDQSDEEQQLIARIRNGDQAAFRVLFDRYHYEVYRFCVLLLGEKAPAEDAYQETFFTFYRMCRDGAEIRNVHGLLLTVARNRCLNHLKGQGRTLPLDRVEEQAVRSDMDAFDAEEHLQKALMQIPVQYREALLLYEVEGYSYKEIAESLETTLHVVKNRIYYAKRALRSLLASLFS